jgi:hypothetical protein
MLYREILEIPLCCEERVNKMSGKIHFFGNICDDTFGANYTSSKISLCHRIIDASDKSRRKKIKNI